MSKNNSNNSRDDNHADSHQADNKNAEGHDKATNATVENNEQIDHVDQQVTIGQSHAISTVVISRTKQKISAVYDRFKTWRKRVLNRWAERWSLLHPNQIIYLIALAIFIFADGEMSENDLDLWLVGLLAFFGMARELWAIFIKVWESTLGRLVLIVLYAALANYTLAMAAQKVNEVIGADPTYLYHTQGLVTFLMLPLWIMSVSVAAMALTFGFLQVFRLFGGVLVFLRLKPKRTKPKEMFPKTFIIIRLVLLVPVVLTLSYSLSWYSKELNLGNSPGLNISWDGGNQAKKQIKDLSLTIIDESLANPDITEQEREDLLSARAELIASESANAESANKEQVTNASTRETSQETSELAEADEAKVLDKLIAAFVFSYEAFQHSHCNKADNERVVYISEEQILAVRKDEASPIGYVFSTRDCIVKT